ncbi:L,D-transpeptidase [Nocardia spumae]|uniref:L,D-transpeptidase n=1 Tax=Nocardia spumae TaxID=2887190 RepID=UPI001D14BA67|nr:L,D-transpeptidase [Nocardia spumae]
MNWTSIIRWTTRTAAAAAIAAAGFAVTVPAGADPVWPGGPDLPGIPQLVPAPPGQISAPCSTAARACLRLSTNEGWLMDNGRVVYGPTPISHGRPGYETPPGVFHVAFKEPYHWSTMHNAEMRWAVFFNGDIATHIGPIEEKSHGCIRMTPEGAKAFYDYVNPGDVFEVVP